MKKRVLAVLLAVCMIVGMGVFAYAEGASESAAPTVKFAKGTYVKIKTGSKDYLALPDENSGLKVDSLTLDNLLGATQETVTIKKIENPSTSKTNVGKDLTMSTAQKDFFDISNPAVVQIVSTDKNKKSTVSNVDSQQKVTARAYFELTSDANKEVIYRVQNDIMSNAESDDIAKGLKRPDGTLERLPHYVLSVSNEESDGAIVSNLASVTEKLNSLTMGLRFYGDNTYKNLSASEIAEISATYKNVNGKEITSHVNAIYDLPDETEVTLNTQLKNPDNDEYAFSCWVDKSNNVLSRSAKNFIWKAGVDPDSVYAVYTELKNRVRINYSATGDGTVGYEEQDSKDAVVKRSILASNDGQISVLEGHEVTFVFKPAEGCEVAHVYVNLDASNEAGRRDVASFGSLLRGGSVSLALRQLVKATNTTEGETAQYTFTSNELSGLPQKIRSIEVVFAKKTPIEAPSGLDMPTVAAEGLTLATGAADENGSNAANGNGDSNGAATTVPAENGAAGNGGSAVSGVVNPATGSTGAVAVFAVLSVAAGAAFVTAKKKED